SFDEVCSIDPESKRALAESRVTMDRLVAATLKKGLIPAVVPEFKGITVGGAIQGAAIESSSHKFGQFHDTCTKYTVLTGEGKFLEISPRRHAELFHALSGSYGSLALLLSAEMKLIDAPKAIIIHCYRFRSIEAALRKIE